MFTSQQKYEAALAFADSVSRAFAKTVSCPIKRMTAMIKISQSAGKVIAPRPVVEEIVKDTRGFKGKGTEEKYVALVNMNALVLAAFIDTMDMEEVGQHAQLTMQLYAERVSDEALRNEVADAIEADMKEPS